MKLKVPLLRDVVMLILGSAGMTHELFFVEEPNMVRVWVCIGLLLGPAALNGFWRLRNALPEEGGPQQSNDPDTPRSSSSSRSPWPPSGS